MCPNSNSLPLQKPDIFKSAVLKILQVCSDYLKCGVIQRIWLTLNLEKVFHLTPPKKVKEIKKSICQKKRNLLNLLLIGTYFSQKWKSKPKHVSVVPHSFCNRSVCHNMSLKSSLDSLYTVALLPTCDRYQYYVQ